MADLDVLTVIVAAQAIGSLAVALTYSILRLRKEERKVKVAEDAVLASKASFEAMILYHSRRLDIEQEKLELARKNGPPSKPPEPWHDGPGGC